MNATMKIMITMPEELVHEVDSITGNRSEFIRASIKDRLRREREKLMIEGYSKERNLDEWETTASDGIES